MKKLSNREKLIYTSLISTIIAIVLLSVITDVFARYSSTLFGDGSIELAKWIFKVNDKKEGEEFSLNIIANENESKISPNSTGYTQFKLENDSNVPVDVTISLKETFINTNVETSTLKVYLDNSYSDEKMIDIEKKNISLKMDSESSKKVTLYWKWVADEDVDQIIAENYNGFTISSTVYAEQTEITESDNMEIVIVDKE